MRYLLIALLLAGCSAAQVNHVPSFYIADGVQSTLMPPGLYGGELSESYVLETIHAGKIYSVKGSVAISQDIMSVVGYSGPVRVYKASLDATGQVQSSASTLLPDEIPAPEYILSDIQLIYFPYQAILRSLPRGMSMTESRREEGIERRLYNKNTLISIISYGENSISVVNVQRNYSYAIHKRD